MIVVDASALVFALTDSHATGDTARAALVPHDDLAVPAHVHAEVLHALRGLLRGRKLAATAAEGALLDLADLELDVHPTTPVLLRRAWELRYNLSAYDALYVALAENLDCDLLTGDARIAAAGVAKCGVQVVTPTP